jgi:putative chitinase
MKEITFRKVTPAMLHRIGATEPLAGKYAEPLSKTMLQYGIRGVYAQSHFLGQVFTESGRLRYSEEIWGPTQAQERYDIRKDLGNTATRDGDGEKYKGRGLIQITGRANYRRFGEHLKRHHDYDGDLIENPAPVAELPLSCMCAGWFWNSHDLNKPAYGGVKREHVTAVTEIVNGGHNHLEMRLKLTRGAHDELAAVEPAEKVEPISPESLDTSVEVPHEPLDPPTDGI